MLWQWKSKAKPTSYTPTSPAFSISGLVAKELSDNFDRLAQEWWERRLSSDTHVDPRAGVIAFAPKSVPYPVSYEILSGQLKDTRDELHAVHEVNRRIFMANHLLTFTPSEGL